MEIASKQEKIKFCKVAKKIPSSLTLFCFLHTTDTISIELIQSNPSCTPKDETQQRIMLFLYISGMCFAPCHSSGRDCGPAFRRLHSRMGSDMRRCKRYDSRLAGADIRFTTRHLFLSASPLKEKRINRRRGGKWQARQTKNILQSKLCIEENKNDSSANTEPDAYGKRTIRQLQEL